MANKHPEHSEGHTERALARIEKSLETLHRKADKMAGELDALKAAVQRNTDVEESAIVLLKGLKDKLDAAIASGNPADLQALSDALGAESTKLADAVTQNTPAA